ncbi:hypothetical protein ACHFCA_27060 [Delftia tsuruhatensis]
MSSRDRCVTRAACFAARSASPGSATIFGVRTGADVSWVKFGDLSAAPVWYWLRMSFDARWLISWFAVPSSWVRAVAAHSFCAAVEGAGNA